MNKLLFSLVLFLMQSALLGFAIYSALEFHKYGIISIILPCYLWSLTMVIIDAMRNKNV